MSDSDGSKVRDVQGKVKWFDPKKGFGFIERPGDKDVFAHYSVIDGQGFRILKDGWVVTYDAEKRDRGWHATRIVIPPDKIKDLQAGAAAHRPPPSSDVELKPKPRDAAEPPPVITPITPSQTRTGAARHAADGN